MKGDGGPILRTVGWTLLFLGIFVGIVWAIYVWLGAVIEETSRLESEKPQTMKGSP